MTVASEQMANRAAEALLNSARSHKRAERAHRRSAQEAMEALSQLRRECERLGIRLVVAPPGGMDHGPRDP
jgi:predicted Zn-ribbon and HTH transcriptional regulator